MAEAAERPMRLWDPHAAVQHHLDLSLFGVMFVLGQVEDALLRRWASSGAAECWQVELRRRSLEIGNMASWCTCSDAYSDLPVFQSPLVPTHSIPVETGCIIGLSTAEILHPAEGSDSVGLLSVKIDQPAMKNNQAKRFPRSWRCQLL
jgi:hypothetical protein